MRDRQRLLLMVLSTGLAIALASGIRRLAPSQPNHSSLIPGISHLLLKPQS